MEICLENRTWSISSMFSQKNSSTGGYKGKFENTIWGIPRGEKLLQRLLLDWINQKKIREHWKSDGIKFKSFTDGITNKLIGCSYTDTQTNRDEVLLVRIYGNNTEYLIDRIVEKKNISYLHEHDLAPELYATCSKLNFSKALAP